MRFNHNSSFALDYLAMDGERLTEAETGGGQDGGARRPGGPGQGGERDAQAVLADGQGPAGPGENLAGGTGATLAEEAAMRVPDDEDIEDDEEEEAAGEGEFENNDVDEFEDDEEEDD